MADEKKAVVKTAEAKKEKPKAQKTIADSVKELGIKPSKTRRELAEKVVAQQHSLGNHKNIKQKPITVDAVTAQIGAIVRCITKNEGPKVWRSYGVVETDTEFRIFLKNKN